ncbi:MAG: MOSC N-terminal beta barrel domain-containing protein [Rhodobiaceae bacterium]|nr:MOSC N-terminal beta barrel domain-containing protein [Rhodobiaceae bacterium]
MPHQTPKPDPKAEHAKPDPSQFTLTNIWRYPVKSMQGESLESTPITSSGIPGDRGWAVVETQTGKTASATRYRQLLNCKATYRNDPSTLALGATSPEVLIGFENGDTLSSQDPKLKERLSDLLGIECTLKPCPTPTHFIDDSPLNLLTRASLRQMQSFSPTSILDPRRFRPNFLFEDSQNHTGFIEFDWSGMNLKLGSATLSSIYPCVRCIMTTHPQMELPQDSNIMKTMIRESNKNLSIYASVETEGHTKLGDMLGL